MRFFAADGLFNSHNSRTKGPELPVCEKATLEFSGEELDYVSIEPSTVSGDEEAS